MQVSETHFVCLLRLYPPQDRPQTCQKFFIFKGLGQIIIRPGVQPAYPVFQSRPGRQHQHRSLFPRFPQPPEHRVAVHARKHHIQNKGIVISSFRPLQASQPVSFRIRSVACLPKQVRHSGRQALFIFYNQDPHVVHLLLGSLQFPYLPHTLLIFCSPVYFLSCIIPFFPTPVQLICCKISLFFSFYQNLIDFMNVL